jgi:hypothetical protein
MTGDDSAWRPAFSVYSTPADVDAAIEEWTAWAVDDLHAQLEADPAFTPGQRIAALALAVPVIRTRTRAAMMAGWRQLQAEARGSTSGGIH